MITKNIFTGFITSNQRKKIKKGINMNNINSNYGNDVNFKGLSALRRATLPQRKNSALIISNILAQDEKDILTLTKHASRDRLSFIRNLTDRYNKDNYYRAVEDREDSTLVNQIFKVIKFPGEAHNDLVSNFNGSMEQLYRIFANTSHKFRRTVFAERVNREILSLHPDANHDLLPELLESSNSSEYVKNYSKYKSYLKLHRKDKDVIKNLDNMVADGTFDKKKYDILYENKNLRSQFRLPETDVFNSEHFVENYSKAGKEFLEYMVTHFYIDKELLKLGADKLLFNMYKTSTDENINLRTELTKILGGIRAPHNDLKVQMEQFEELNKLYETIDKDSNAKKFIQDFVNKPVYNIISARSMNKILTIIPTAKLAMFSENAKNIIRQTSGEERIKTLINELENPFFETEMTAGNRKKAEKYGYAKKRSYLQTLIIKLKNEIKILQYRHIAPEEPVMPEIAKPEKTPPVQTKEIDVVEALDKKIQEAYKEEESVVKPVVSKKTSREEVKKNVFEIISSKLGPKAYAVQQDAYGAYATKIRLGMLPEIFSSIADTRKADRAAGKYRINSSNKDALDLYLLINGNNKKYVNYLLKKRNVDNTRMFEVKDIISMLKKAEAKIQEAKRTNPEYRARDARQYYNHLYEAKIQQYGKLKRTVNKKA